MCLYLSRCKYHKTLYKTLFARLMTEQKKMKTMLADKQSPSLVAQSVSTIESHQFHIQTLITKYVIRNEDLDYRIHLNRIR